MNGSLVLALFVVVSTWLVVSSWVIVDRALYDRLVARLRSGAGERRLSWRRVARLAEDSSSDADLAAALSRYVLDSDEQRVVAVAQDPCAGWKGIEATRILALSGHPLSLKLLENMLGDGDEEVRAAAVTILAEIEGDEATVLLIETMQRGSCPPRWAAALLDRRPVAVPVLLALLEDPRVSVRAVATQLLGKTDGSDQRVVEKLLGLCGDSEADVRAAACRALGERRDPQAVEQLDALLADPVWFVQIRAARALGRLHAVGSARKIAELLASPRWWVRQAAKDALVDLGPEVIDQLVPLLDHADPFARNSCAEVLQNLGIVGELLATANDSTSPRMAAEAAKLLRKILDAGGSRVEEAALGRPETPTQEQTVGRPARARRSARAAPRKRRAA